jgi:hypothetical protein
MKIILGMIICSQIGGTCLPPYQWPTTFDTQYECLMEGYQQSIIKMEELGSENVNKYNMYIRFTCTPETTI